MLSSIQITYVARLCFQAAACCKYVDCTTRLIKHVSYIDRISLQLVPVMAEKLVPMRVSSVSQSLHRLRMRWCSQQADPPHSLHACHSRWCSKKAGPPHSLHRLRMRRCSQIDVRLPYSLHLAFCRWCTRSFCRLLSPRPNPTPGDDAALAWARATRLPCRGCRPTGARSHRAVAHCRGTRYPVT